MPVKDAFTTAEPLVSHPGRHRKLRFEEHSGPKPNCGIRIALRTTPSSGMRQRSISKEFKLPTGSSGNIVRIRKNRALEVLHLKQPPRRLNRMSPSYFSAVRQVVTRLRIFLAAQKRSSSLTWKRGKGFSGSSICLAADRGRGPFQDIFFSPTKG